VLPWDLADNGNKRATSSPQSLCTPENMASPQFSWQSHGHGDPVQGWTLDQEQLLTSICEQCRADSQKWQWLGEKPDFLKKLSI
jgi:hypothetical protein